MADNDKGTPAPDAGKDNKGGGQPAPEMTKTVDAGGTPPANPKVDSPKPDDGKGNDDRPRQRFNYRDEIRRLQGNLEAAESEAAKANEELAKLRGMVKDGSGNDGELRKQVVAAEQRAKNAEDKAKKAVEDAKKAEDALAFADKRIAAALAEADKAMAQIAAAGDNQPLKPPKKTATATADGPSGPGTQPEIERPDPPTTRTETQPIRREPDPPRPTKVAGDDCGDGKCCCHPFTTTWLLATVIAIVVAALGALGWWLATKSSSSATSSAPTAITAPAPATDPLAADEGQFIASCLAAGGSPTDCANGFGVVTH